jgi:putative transposase
MRKFRRNDEWLAIFEEQKQSGLKIIDYCQQNAISTTTFYGTRARLGKTNLSKSSFIKITENYRR